jgi:hypothetical protein
VFCLEQPAGNLELGGGVARRHQPVVADFDEARRQCVFRPSRSAIPGEADHPFRSIAITPERDDVGMTYFAGFVAFVNPPRISELIRR